MADTLPTLPQESPEVRSGAVAVPMLAVLSVVVAVLALLCGVFWWMFGTLPSRVPEAPVSTFPAPHVTDVGTGELARVRTQGAVDLTVRAAIPIEAAMDAVLARPDPFAPLIPASAVPDSPAVRAIQALAAAGGTSPRGREARPAASGSAATLDDQARVPASALRGTPGYLPPAGSATPEVTR
ncbi:hypothetical protein [Mangrovicella endophytica]|uniref:hypothetical protein n=1 Tax=Mangrovicella endophytica TaxID=2066697 RepID=UPI0012FFF453|nr:hypothetical protein [Mangrovicella endophytica]